MGVVDDLIRGRDAFERREWAAARDHLAIPHLDDRDPEDLRSLATAAFLVGDRDTCIDALQHAFRKHRAAGETLAATRDAFWLALTLITTGEPAVGGGWSSRAERLLADEPEDVVERGYLSVLAMYRHIFAGQFGEAMERSTAVLDYGRRFDDADLVAEGLVSQGRLRLYAGQVAEGLALLDEAMVGVLAGEVSPIIAGMTYCTMVEGCQEIGDFQRMTSWTEALNHWCSQQPTLVSFTGQCAVHRGQIMRIQGAFAEALAELDLARTRYEANGMDPAVGLAYYERGQVLRQRGEHEAAAEAYDAAAAAGHDPQPGLALLWLAQRRPAAAAAAVRRRLDEVGDPVHRSQVLPAAVEILLASGDAAEARVAADELAAIATAFDCVALTASAHHALGIVALTETDASASLTHLRQGWRAWLDIGARYEAARTRAQIGLAFRALGDEDSAVSELTVAGRSFVELGAEPDARVVEGWLGSTFPDRLTAREVEVLGLVAAGRTNPQIAAELFLSEKTVARHLSNIFTKVGVSTRTAAAAYAFKHDLA